MVEGRVGRRIAALFGMLAVLVVARQASAQEVMELPGGDRPLALDARQVYSVGSTMGDDWETFGDVTSVAFDREGNLYILDRQNHRVVVVDPEGNFLREIGKEGDGPGELRTPMGMVVSPDGTVAVQDMGHQAFVIYQPDGSFLRNARNEFQKGLLGGSISYHPRGGAVGASELSISVSSGSGGPRVSTNPGAPVRFVPFSEGGEPEDVYQAWRMPPETSTGGGGASFSTSGGAMRLSGMSALRAFEPPLLTGVLPDGRIVLSDSSSYALKLLTPEGELSAILKRPIDPRPVTRADREAEKNRRLESLESSGGPRVVGMVRSGGGGGGSTSMNIGGDAMKDMMRGRIENMVFAEEIPVVAGMAVDWEGGLWIERTGRKVGEDGPIDIVTDSGTYLGSIAPDGIRIPDAFGPNRLAAYIETDELDVASVVVRRLSAIR